MRVADHEEDDVSRETSSVRRVRHSGGIEDAFEIRKEAELKEQQANRKGMFHVKQRQSDEADGIGGSIELFARSEIEGDLPERQIKEGECFT